MAFYDVLKLKKEGFTDEQIALAIANAEGNSEGVQQMLDEGFKPKQIINAFNWTGASAFETFKQSAKQEMGSEITGAMQLLGKEPTDTEEEALRRQMESENPIAGLAGTFVGGLVNPSTLIPSSIYAKGMKGVALAGAIAGGAGGFLQPRYEEDDLSRLTSTVLGTVGGATLAYGLPTVVSLLKKHGAKFKGLFDDVAETTASKADLGDEVATTTEKAVDTSGKATEQTVASTELNKAVDSAAVGSAVPENTIVDVFNPYDAVLEKELRGAKPAYGKYVPEFESDLDKALYIIGNKKQLSDADHKYLDWVKEVTGISDENIIRDLGTQVKAHIKNTADKSFIPRSNIESIVPVNQAINAAGDVSSAITIKPFVNNFEINKPLTIDSNAWKALDTNSKLVYNIGRQILEGGETLKIPKLSLKDPNVQTAFKEVKEVFPKIKNKEAGELMLKYAKTMEDLSFAHGKEWTPTNFKQFAKDGGITELDRIALAKAGLLDGCNL